MIVYAITDPWIPPRRSLLAGMPLPLLVVLGLLTATAGALAAAMSARRVASATTSAAFPNCRSMSCMDVDNSSIAVETVAAVALFSSATMAAARA